MQSSKLIDPLDEALGLALRAARKEAGLTQRQVAGALGWHNANITWIEKGRNRIKATDLIRICRFIGITPGEVVDAADLGAVQREAKP